MIRNALGLLALLAALSGAMAADVVIVSQHDRKFSPDHVALPVGGVVRVMNDDRVTHHLYVDTPAMHFDSGEQPVGKSIDITFSKAGTYTLRCAIHPTMRLDVAVQGG